MASTSPHDRWHLRTFARRTNPLLIECLLAEGLLCATFFCWASAVGQAPELLTQWRFETLHLKTGAPLRGLVIDEADGSIMMRCVIQRPGEPTRVMTFKFLPPEVDHIDRLDQGQPPCWRSVLRRLIPRASPEKPLSRSSSLNRFPGARIQEGAGPMPAGISCCAPTLPRSSSAWRLRGWSRSTRPIPVSCRPEDRPLIRPQSFCSVPAWNITKRCRVSIGTCLTPPSSTPPATRSTAAPI